MGSGGGGGFNFWEVLGASIPRPFRRPRAEEQGKVPTRNGSVVVRSLAVCGGGTFGTSICSNSFWQSEVLYAILGVM